MRRVFLHPLMVGVYRVVVAAVLLYAGVKKIRVPMEFARLLKEYQILPDQVINMVAVLLPWAEVVCGICLLSGLWVVGAAVLLSGMNVIFVTAIAYRAWLIMSTSGVNFFDLSFDCGCGFGVVYIPTKMVENLILGGVGLMIFLAKRNAQD